MKINKVILLVLLCMSFFSTGFVTVVFAETAEDNYQLYCAQCHGIKGNGNGINVSDMQVAPRNHTDTAEMSKLSNSDLYDAIAQGGTAVGKSTLMPPWDGLMTDVEMKEMVAYLRDLCKCNGQ